MVRQYIDISPRQAAIVAGIGFLISFLGVIYTGIFVNGLIVEGDPATTVRNIMESQILFRSGIISWFLVIVGDMIRAWALWIFFREVNRSLALLAAWFMLVHDAIFGSALMNLVSAALLSDGAGSLSALGREQLQSMVIHALEKFNYGFEIGIFFFSFHLGILGLLVFSSGYVPKVFGVLLFLSFLGYLLDSVVRILLPVYPEMLWTIVMGPCLIGELALMVWLVIKGGKEPKVG